ncbi:MAG: hypothetical protein JY451_01670 [Erythrobacter sp.]|nr:MAG: hypothetical protein JY451_01670 [Erythrobacter sp.]
MDRSSSQKRCAAIIASRAPVRVAYWAAWPPIPEECSIAKQGVRAILVMDAGRVIILKIGISVQGIDNLNADRNEGRQFLSIKAAQDARDNRVNRDGL